MTKRSRRGGTKGWCGSTCLTPTSLALRVNTRIEVNAENLRFPAIEYSAFPPPRPCSMPSALNLLPCGRDMETEWVPELMGIVGMSFPQLPLLWDADFLYGPKTVE